MSVTSRALLSFGEILREMNQRLARVETSTIQIEQALLELSAQTAPPDPVTGTVRTGGAAKPSSSIPLSPAGRKARRNPMDASPPSGRPAKTKGAR